MLRQRSRREKYSRKARVHPLAYQTGIETPHVSLSRSGAVRAGNVIMTRRRFEVRAKADSCWQLYQWLDEHFRLVVSANDGESLIVLRPGDFLKQLQFREGIQTDVPKTSGKDSSTRYGKGPEGKQA